MADLGSPHEPEQLNHSTKARPKLAVHKELQDYCSGEWSVAKAITALSRAYCGGPQHQADLVEGALQLAHLLLIKNQGYGNSALDPVEVFSAVGTMERLGVRLDDKLSRLSRGRGGVSEDTEFDIAGYLILRFVLRQQQEGKLKKVLQREHKEQQ